MPFVIASNTDFWICFTNSYSGAEERFAEAAILAEESKNKADALHMDSTALLSKSRQPLPSYDGDALRESANDIKDKVSLRKVN